MKPATLLLLSCLLAAAFAGTTLAGGSAACQDEAGPKQAARYVRDCIAVSPATHPPCNAQNPCALILDEIKRGCAILGAGPQPARCRAYTAAPAR